MHQSQAKNRKPPLSATTVTTKSYHPCDSSPTTMDLPPDPPPSPPSSAGRIDIPPSRPTSFGHCGTIAIHCTTSYVHPYSSCPLAMTDQLSRPPIFPKSTCAYRPIGVCEAHPASYPATRRPYHPRLLPAFTSTTYEPSRCRLPWMVDQYGWTMKAKHTSVGDPPAYPR